ncbi:MAG: sigma-54-dependent Fis family transcriptional regulator [Phycisphaerales bacterium]|nr:MAG: sigma-54-dependent Fis family transcriptional regulator [Phycisphaerales bacterium]
MDREILLADDEVTFRETFAKVLREEGMSVTVVGNGADAIDAVTRQPFGIVVMDIRMPGIDGIKALREIMRIRPETRVIMITAYGTVEMAVEAIKLGACDYVMKPVAMDDIVTKIRQNMKYLDLQEENKQLKHELGKRFDISQIIGKSPQMQSVFDMIRKVAPTKSNVLITGKSGTGKELVARAIHSLAAQNSKHFLAVNCSAIPETLLESELFGHKKGSFTSAIRDKKGLFESACGGTLFLDEIGHMPMSCQVKLLRAVEHRQIIPVGATEPVDIDLRLTAATNKDLPKEIKAGRFREDLYYRMNVVGIHLPPLRERKEDIPLLVEHFIKKFNAEMGKTCTGVSDAVMRLFMSYEWKGNIRELENVIERAVIFAEGDIIKISDIGLLGSNAMGLSKEDETLQTAVRAYEKEYIRRVLSKHDWNKGEAAKALNVGLSSLYRKIDELEIESQKPRRSKAGSKQ